LSASEDHFRRALQGEVGLGLRVKGLGFRV
jgi:hypothetical protein